MAETNNNQQWYDVGKKATLIFDCAGDLVVRGHTEASLVVAGKESDAVQVVGNAISSTSGIKVLVPRDASIIIKRVAGDLRIKNVQGNIEATSDVSGDTVLVAIGGTVTLNRVHGSLKARDVSGAMAVSDVTGDVRVRRSGHVTINKVFGDVELGKMTGDIEINEIYGDAALNGVVGTVALAQVNGDCVVSNLGGQTTITSRDDIRIQGPLTVGAHIFKSGSTIALRWRPDSNLNLDATAPLIVNTLTLTNEAVAEDRLVGTMGEGNVAVHLEAADRITVKPVITADGEERWEGHIESEFDFTGMTEQLLNEVNTRIDQAVDRIPNFTTQAESLLRQTEDAISKMMKQADFTREQFETRYRPGSKPRRTARPNAAASSASESPGSSNARLKVLKMLEEGKITVKEAGELLAALE